MSVRLLKAGDRWECGDCGGLWFDGATPAHVLECRQLKLRLDGHFVKNLRWLGMSILNDPFFDTLEQDRVKVTLHHEPYDTPDPAGMEFPRWNELSEDQKRKMRNLYGELVDELGLYGWNVTGRTDTH